MLPAGLIYLASLVEWTEPVFTKWWPRAPPLSFRSQLWLTIIASSLLRPTPYHFCQVCKSLWLADLSLLKNKAWVGSTAYPSSNLLARLFLVFVLHVHENQPTTYGSTIRVRISILSLIVLLSTFLRSFFANHNWEILIISLEWCLMKLRPLMGVNHTWITTERPDRMARQGHQHLTLTVDF